MAIADSLDQVEDGIELGKFDGDDAHLADRNFESANYEDETYNPYSPDVTFDVAGDAGREYAHVFIDGFRENVGADNVTPKVVATKTLIARISREMLETWPLNINPDTLAYSFLEKPYAGSYTVGEILSKLKNYVAQEFVLSSTATGVTAIRGGYRAVLADDHKGYSLGKYLSGQLPKHYRSLEGISSDFGSGNSCLEAVLGMIACMPTAESFQNSHCGEIAGAQFVEEVLGYRRLYSKLTMTTSANTNAHKMDGLFVKTSCTPFEFLFVEAKSSVLPTTLTKTKTHRSGILKSMLTSLHTYDNDDPRFEFARIRDNLESSFTADEAAEIKRELTPPGPENLKFLGISVTNASTVNTDDDDFILVEKCDINFNYHALVVTDLAELAKDAYGRWEKMKAAAA